MIETPKYLLFVFQNEQVTKDKELNRIVNENIKELIIGEEPTIIGDEQFGDRDVYLASKENIENKELYDYLIGNGADVYTCRFDLTAESGELEELKPFEWIEKSHVEEDDTIDIVETSNDFVVDVLKLNLDTDIFQFVKNPEENPNYMTFAQEQSGLSIEYGRLGKDIMLYLNTDLVDLVKKVENSLADDSDYNNLIAQEEGIEILKQNSQAKIEELEREFEEKIDTLSMLAMKAFRNGNEKAEAENKELIRIEQERAKEVIEAQKSRDKEILKGNQKALTETKYNLEKKIIDNAEKFVSFDIRRLYNYENRFKMARDLVVNNFSVDTQKEVERIEKSVDEMTKIVEEKQEVIESEKTNTTKETTKDKTPRLSLDIEEQVPTDSIVLDVVKEPNKEISKPIESLSEVKATTEAVNNKKFSNLFPVSDSDEYDTTDEIEPEINLDVQDNELESEETQEEVPAEVVAENKIEKETSESETEEEFYKRIRANDTIEFKDDFERKQQEDNLVDEAESDNENEIEEQVQKEKQVGFVKKNARVILLIAGIIGVVSLSVKLLLGNPSNSNQLEESKPKSSQVIKKSSKESRKEESSETSKTTESDSNKLLPKETYDSNLKILTNKNSNTGMYINDKGKISGTMKVKDSKGDIQVIYIDDYTKDGMLTGKDKDGNIKQYPKEWVDKYISLLVQQTGKGE